MPPVNERDVDWTETEHDPTRFRRKHLSDAASGDEDPELGCSLYELPPGARSWPYHYHAGNAEAMYVLAGTGRLRLDGEERPVEAGDYVPFPTGPDGAHRVINDGGDGDDTDDDAPLRFLVFSEMDEPDVTVYPDSGKFGVYTGSAPGGREERTVGGYYRLDDDVDYWEGE